MNKLQKKTMNYDTSKPDIQRDTITGTVPAKLLDVVPVSRLHLLVPNLCSADRVAYWMRTRHKNGMEECGALFVRGGVAYASLQKLGAWLTTPEQVYKRRRRKST